MLSKNNPPKDSKDSDFFIKKIKEQVLMDIEDGEYEHILEQIDVEKDWKVLEKKLRDSDNRKKRRIYTRWACALVVTIAVVSYFYITYK